MFFSPSTQQQQQQQRQNSQLQSEKVKNLVNIAAYGAPVDKVKLNDPHAALFRDNFALGGNMTSRPTSAIATQSERDTRELCEQQLLVLSQKCDQQRQTHAKIVNLLKFTRDKHLKLMQELEEERARKAASEGVEVPSAGAKMQVRFLKGNCTSVFDSFLQILTNLTDFISF